MAVLKNEKFGHYFINDSDATGGVAFDYVAYGTKAFLKTPKHEVREARCIGFTLMRVEDFDGKYEVTYSTDMIKVYEWQVAGYDHTILSTSKTDGVLYNSIEEANDGTSNVDRYTPMMKHIANNAYFDIVKYVKAKYGEKNFPDRMHWDGHNEVRNTCFKCSVGGWSGTKKARTNIRVYYVTVENTIDETWGTISCYMDKSGVHFSVEELDKNPRFCALSHNDAYAKRKKLKVFTFDDEPKQTEVVEEEVTLSITIKKNRISYLKEIGAKF